MNLTAYNALFSNTINGKKLTAPQINLFAKLDEMGVKVTAIPGATQRCTNPVNGFSDEICPPIAALIEWVYEVYSTYGNGGTMSFRGTKVAIGTFDRVRMLILNLDSEAYSNFID